MADTTPSPVSVGKAVWLSVLLVVAPERFAAEEALDDEWRKNHPSGRAAPRKAQIIRAALAASFFFVAVSGAVGYGVGALTQVTGWCFSAGGLAWLQVTGASVLLWGTLFVRGYEITSWSGVTYSERVNQWIYRTMYCVGTSIAVFSLAVQQCKP
jgi:hypothetical protein